MTDLANRIRTSQEWILDQQQSSGGWGEQRGRYTNSINTAEVVIGLLDTTDVRPGSAPIQRAVDYLVGHQCGQGQAAGCWYRDVKSDGAAASVPVPDTCRTALATEALVRAGRPAGDPAVAAAVAWLDRTANHAGGWPFGAAGASVILPTCRAVTALLEVAAAGSVRARELAVAGLSWLADQRRPNGGFGPSDRLQAANTITVILVLQAARRRGVPVAPDHELRALDWMLEHPDHVMRPVEEPVVLDPHMPEASYEFVHALDALTLRVLAESPDARHRSTRVFADAQTSLKDRMDDDGGIFGFRTYSWSTAQALSALHEARSAGVEAFPERPAEAPEGRAGAPPAPWSPQAVLLGLVLVLAVSVAVVVAAAVAGGVGLGVAVIVLIVVILGFFLVLAGRLTGQGWVDTAKAALGALPSGRPDGG